MARIEPFAAYRYDLGRVQANDVLTQPYDKITPAMRQRYLAQSPYNLVRVILGEAQPTDHERENVYSRAAACLNDWIAQGVMRRDLEPAIYAYTQTFTEPDSGAAIVRSGFIALSRIEEYANRVVFRHEQTLTGPKQDRLALLRATRTHLGQLFMLYSDPTRATEAELMARAQEPILEATDEYGTQHRLFRETDAGVIARLQQQMATRPLIIADGHHRYETALQWRNEQHAHAPDRSDAPWDWVMMTLVNLDAPGLVVLPTHRLVYGLPHFDAAGLLRRLEEYFVIETLAETVASGRAGWDNVRARLAAAGPLAIAAALTGKPNLVLLRLKAEVDLAAVFPDSLPEQRQLNVLPLHELILNRSLAITPAMVREEQNLRYVRDVPEALQSVEGGVAQALFLLNGISAATVRDVALAGGVMPQKSTDFFPKLLSGLTLYRVE